MNDKINNMSKDQFMQKCASKEWNACCADTNKSIAEYLGFKKINGSLPFSKLPKKLQKRLLGFAEHELEYSDDWARKQGILIQ